MDELIHPWLYIQVKNMCIYKANGAVHQIN